QFTAGRRKVVPDQGSDELAGRISGGRDDRVELCDAGDHRVILVEDDLVVVLVHNLLDNTIIDHDLRCRVRFSFHPYFDLPPVPVEVRALPVIMEESMAGVYL